MKPEEKLNNIIALLEEKGYNSIAQLMGYAELGNAEYITRHGGAREMIKEIDKSVILDYLQKNKT